MDLRRGPKEPQFNGWLGLTATHSANTNSPHKREAFLLSYAMASKLRRDADEGAGYCTAVRDDGDYVKASGDPSWRSVRLLSEIGHGPHPAEHPRNEARTVMTNEVPTHSAR